MTSLDSKKNPDPATAPESAQNTTIEQMFAEKEVAPLATVISGEKNNQDKGH